MKKFTVLAMAMTMALTCVACGKDDADETTTAATTKANTEATTDGTTEKTPEADNDADVMSYSDYAAAELDTEVTIEAYVQAKQSWWEDEEGPKATFYLQDEDGAYFIYNMKCTKDEYDTLTTGTKIRVKGFKSEWSGEVEIIDASFEVLDGNYVAEATDVTALLAKDELIDKQNQFVSFKGMTVEAAAEGSDAAYLYKHDGSGSDGDDLYFKASVDGQTYTFTVESYLCDNTTDVYKAVKELNVGDKIDMEGFLYWYNGANPHITSVTAAN